MGRSLKANLKANLKVCLHLWVAALVLGSAAPAVAQVTIYTSTEQIPLKAYAEFRLSGVLHMSSGSLKDVPTIADFRMLRCNLTGWVPGRAMVASEKLFESEYAERRLISIATRKVGVTATDVRIADLEQPARIAELVNAVNEETGTSTYFFFVLAGDGMMRYYPFKMKTAR
jgi:hypothetical protein